METKSPGCSRPLLVKGRRKAVSTDPGARIRTEIEWKDQKMTTEKSPTATDTAEDGISLSRRSALMKLGLATVAVYAAPALLTLSEAEAGKRDGKSSGKKSRNGKKSRRSRKSKKTRKSNRRSRRSRRSRRT